MHSDAAAGLDEEMGVASIPVADAGGDGAGTSPSPNSQSEHCSLSVGVVSFSSQDECQLCHFAICALITEGFTWSQQRVSRKSNFE